MTTTINDTLFEALKSSANNIGLEHGRNAAEWFIQDAFGGRYTGDSKAAARRVLQMLEDGDPAIWDSANVPNLSGEWADSYTEPDLLRDCAHGCKVDSDIVDALEPEEIDDICREYQDGASWGWSSAVESSARIHSED
jgi:hypothetical protein